MNFDHMTNAEIKHIINECLSRWALRFGVFNFSNGQVKNTTAIVSRNYICIQLIWNGKYVLREM